VARRRGQQLLEQFSLADTGTKLAKEYSGGMRRRLDLAATLVAGPEVLFLDEPTTGLDPRGRNELWGVLDTLVDGGTTILLTTQYLEEAERLADDIVVIDHGQVIARGDARQLKRQIGGDQLLIVPVNPDDLAAVAEVVGRIVGVQPHVDPATRRITAPAAAGASAIAEVANELVAAGIAVEDLGLHQPTLDDVFLTLTGGPQPERAAVAEAVLQ
jgi:ABC-2 type transport system ATP-binding protein